jgi:hypothetical protein
MAENGGFDGQDVSEVTQSMPVRPTVTAGLPKGTYSSLGDGLTYSGHRSGKGQNVPKFVYLWILQI